MKRPRLVTFALALLVLVLLVPLAQSWFGSSADPSTDPPPAASLSSDEHAPDREFLEIRARAHRSPSGQSESPIPTAPIARPNR